MKNTSNEQIYLLNDLPLNIRHLLNESNFPWLNSLEFCTRYVTCPAEYLLLKSEDEKILEAVFYRVKKKKIGLRIVEIIGFPDVADADIQRLRKTNRAHLAVLNRLENPVERNEEWHTAAENVYCKSYVTIADLPVSKDGYLNRLGKKDRKELPKYLQKLQNHLGNAVEIRIDCAEDIKFEDVMALEYLNRERRAKRGKGVNSSHEILHRQQHRWSLTKSIGLLVTFRFQGEIIGGTLNYIYGDKAVMIMVAHNPKYDSFRLGKLSIWQTMTFLIDKGITECNFLWGRNVFKTQFLGVEYPWSVHLLSPYPGLTMLWKKWIIFEGFYSRAWFYVKTKARFFNFIDR